MSKGMDRKKDSKKKPAKSLLEKRAVKREKKGQRANSSVMAGFGPKQS